MAYLEQITRWKEAAASYDNGKGIPLREYNPDDKEDMAEVCGLLQVTDPLDRRRLQSYIRTLRECGGGTRTDNETTWWYQVCGTIERNKAVAGARFTLYTLAKGGFYPFETTHSTAFAVQRCPDDESKRLLSATVVFSTKAQAQKFFVSVDSYVNKTRGLSIRVPLSITQVKPYDNERLVLESDYVANEADGEAPHDSPVWDVELSSMDVSGQVA